MTSDPPGRAPKPRPLAGAPDEDPFNDILGVLGEQLGEAAAVADPRGRRRLKKVELEFESDGRAVHDMAGNRGYSLASNWFTQFLAQLVIANSVTKSQLCVFLYVVGGQIRGTGITQYTQQEITDGLNAVAREKGGKLITRSTVNRAIKALCEYHWLERAGNGKIRVNARLWFSGNSDAQREVLEQISAAHDHNMEAFPYGVGPEKPLQEEFDFGEQPYGRKKRIG